MRKRPSVEDFVKIVAWLQTAVGDADPRGFDAAPLLEFARRYRIAKWNPEDIYCEYVRYQCQVIEFCAKHLSETVVNNISFAEMQQWYESLIVKATE